MRALLITLCFVAAAGVAVAQTRAPQPPAAAPAPPSEPQPQAPQPDPPYHQRMERLAEVLGGLHHLRPLCVTGEVQVWRQEMANLIEAEQPPEARRDRLVAAFNRGLSAFRETYRSCTDSARLVGERYRTEAVALAREIATRYAD